MYLLQLHNDGHFVLENFSKKNQPPYAILSHTWGKDIDEVTFQDIKDRTGREKPGYEKIAFCAREAAKDRLAYFWVDTCCIDQTNSSEVSEAIISMYKWYRKAAKCYVYLSDVSFQDKVGTQTKEWMPAFRKSRWFTRGWTLQELMAPSSVQFFSQEEALLGDKQSLLQEVHDVTGISVEVLEGRKQLSQLTYTERISWMNHRQTQREEDRAYALLGILGIHMMPHYGEEGESAMRRLRREFRSTHLHPDVTMSKLPKHSKSSKKARVLEMPDRHKTLRPLCRSYEPLVLLYTLGSTAQDYIPVSLLTTVQAAHLPLGTTRRNFLEDLAYLCDYGVGNDTVVAIALQSLSQRHVLWIASNTSPTRQIVSFAQTVLNCIEQISISVGVCRSERKRCFITTCIEFAAPQIKEDMASLIRALHECKNYLQGNNFEEGVSPSDS